MDEWEKQALAAYVADYLTEEIIRGNVEIDSYMVREAIDAYFGGAADEGDADAANNPRILGQIFGGGL